MKNKTNKLLVGMLIIALLTGTALGYDASTAYTVTLNFIIPTDTTFTVGLAGAETTIDFNPPAPSSKCVEPDSQVNSTNTPIATITNGGNVNSNYSVNLTATAPGWVLVNASAANGAAACSLSTNFNSSALWTAGWNNIAPSGTAKVFLFANFTSAAAGTTARTFQINARGQ